MFDERIVGTDHDGAAARKVSAKKMGEKGKWLVKVADKRSYRLCYTKVYATMRSRAYYENKLYARVAATASSTANLINVRGRCT